MGRLPDVFPRQGHYVMNPAILGAYAPVDITIGCIGELAGADLATPFGNGTAGDAEQEAS
ncbi:hypothetical protein [Paraburkholderia sediminicola]|uniref:hypothetical protein n=1 Tax=Paraburkholderia sediminicola TaxID=458836 RepID=UPI0038B93B4E